MIPASFSQELVQLRSELQTLRAESEPKGSKDDGTDATVHRQPGPHRATMGECICVNLRMWAQMLRFAY